MINSGDVIKTEYRSVTPLGQSQIRMIILVTFNNDLMLRARYISNIHCSEC